MVWRLLSRTLKVTGTLAFLGILSTALYLIHTWRFTRPYAPDPGAGWTVTLPWCLGAYGTPAESAFLDACAWWSCGAALAVFLGVGIDYFRLGVSPQGRRG